MAKRGARALPAAATTRSGPVLRERAEALLRDEASTPDASVHGMPEATRQLLHDLRVYQVELEMQNEELRRTQAALDAERSRYFELYDLAPVGYCTLNALGMIEQANLTAATLLRVTRSVLVQRPLTSFIVAADQDIFYLCKQKLLASTLPQTCELRMQRADSSEFWASLAMTVGQDDAGKTVLRIALTDVTANKLGQADLLESEDRYRNLFNSMDEGYCIIDVIFDDSGEPIDYRFVEVNRAFAKQSGMPAMTGKRVREVYPELEQAWFESFGDVARSGKPLRFAGQTKAVEGRWFDVYAFRIGGAGSVRVAVIFNDISMRMLADAERTQLTMAMRQEHTDLQRAIRVAELANQAKSDFLSGMSHELRTPLSAILGFAQLIESGSPVPTLSQQRSLEQILRSGWYLLDLINEILDLAAVESGKMALSLEPIALNDVIAECETMVEPQAQQRGVSMSVRDPDAKYFVIADWTRLKQVLINILSNAIKYNRPGGSVTVECSDRDRGRVRVSVVDTGLGLPPEKIAQLFQPFNRLGRETSVEQGTGIGLVVSKRLIELMGGTIGVDSVPGQGSVFWIELNLTARRQAGVVGTPGAAGAEAAASPATQTQTLLYVEDNPANLMLIEELVARRADLRMLSARDGLSGVALARSALPDVIVMDINLPGISGVEALAALRAEPLTADIPVIALSASAMPRDIERGHAAGFFRYLTKPIKVNEFMDALDLAFDCAKKRAAGGECDAAQA